MTQQTMNYSLLEFTDTVPPVIVTAELQENTIRLDYKVSDQVVPVWPEALAGMPRVTGLWESTCFELFLGHTESTSYLEVNLAPSGAWQVFSFSDVRSGQKESDDIEVRLIDASKQNQLVAELVTDIPAGDIRLGLSAVLELAEGKLLYFALRHGTRPDFHDPANHVIVKR